MIGPRATAAPGPLNWRWLVLILCGGAAGTSVRWWLESLFAPPAESWPWVTFWINVSGSLLLGVLLGSLATIGPDAGWRRGARLGLGTGVMGGYTTYSTFAVETLALVQAGTWWLAACYAGASVLTGFLAALAGLWLGRSVSGGGGRA